MATNKQGKELTVVHTFSVQPSQWKHIQQQAFDRDMSVSKYICNALRYYQFTAERQTDFIVQMNPDFTLTLTPIMPSKN